MQRALGPLLGLLLAAGGVLALLVFFSGRDDAGVPGAPHGPGRELPDLGAKHIPRGAAHPAYASDPPTSGPHVPLRVPGDGVPLVDDQILQALELGNVVILYPGRRGTLPPAPLRAVQNDVAAGPTDGARVRVGQAVILAPRPGARGFVAVAWRRLLRTARPDDPALERFADLWLGTTPAG